MKAMLSSGKFFLLNLKEKLFDRFGNFIFQISTLLYKICSYLSRKTQKIVYDQHLAVTVNTSSDTNGGDL